MVALRPIICSWNLHMLAAAPRSTTETSALQSQWDSFKAQHGRIYEGSEETNRFAIFLENHAYIEVENKKNHSYTLGVTPFMDLSQEEFRGRFVRRRVAATSTPSLGLHTWSGDDLPASVDWQVSGATTEVMDENQNGCFGACWAFSATGALEGAYQINSGNLLSLSKQQLMDCAGTSFGNYGCDGGTMNGAFTYSQQTAICSEESYSYFGPVETCKASSCDAALPRGAVSGYRNVAKDDASLQSALSQQPVSVAVQGAWGKGNAFQFYTGGVLGAECGQSVDHGVLVVGYGTSAAGDYWKVKNTYGKNWGIDGYALLARGVPGQSGTDTCGILTMMSYPVITSAELHV